MDPYLLLDEFDGGLGMFGHDVFVSNDDNDVDVGLLPDFTMLSFGRSRTIDGKGDMPLLLRLPVAEGHNAYSHDRMRTSNGAN